jgi:hypothetical protein
VADDIYAFEPETLHAHRSEELLGRWLRQRKGRGGLILSTKGAHPRIDSMHVPSISKAGRHRLDGSGGQPPNRQMQLGRCCGGVGRVFLRYFGVGDSVGSGSPTRAAAIIKEQHPFSYKKPDVAVQAL